LDQENTMNRLDQLHYLPVFLKPVRGRIIVFNPVFHSAWSENSEFLNQLKLKPLVAPYLNNSYFRELNKPISFQDDAAAYEKTLLSFCVQSISLPEKLTIEEYFALMEGNYLSVTEKFLSRHVLGHVASSRHILLKNIQIKGVGRTASTQQLSYPNMNGFIHTSEAVRGYFNGQLLKVSLPYGAVNVQAVLSVANDKLHSSLVIRDALSHRLAQIEPVFLSAHDKKTLKDEVEHYFSGLGTIEILDRVIEQHICLWVMGVEHPMTVDNLALSGFAMDEEDMRPVHNMEGLSFDFDLHLQDESIPTISDWKTLDKLEFSVSSVLNHRFSTLLKWYDEAVSWIRDETSSLQDYQERKIRLFQNILERFFDKKDVERFLSFLLRFESQNIFYNNEAFQMLREFEENGFEISLSDLQMQLRQILIRARLKLKLKSDLRGQFNQLKRTPTEKIIQGMGRFEMLDFTQANDSALQNSSQIHRLVNRQAFSLAKIQTLNLETAQAFLDKNAGGFEVRKLTVFTKAGLATIKPSEWIDTLRENEEIILVEITINFLQNDFVLPTPKMPLRFTP
jgi:hypothetical protein